jgi:DNA polymerase-3 subunit alpha
MGKKKAELMAEQRAKFVDGCKQANNIDPALANVLFDKIETFAGYGFNKSHSVAYAFVAYQTAFLKANYPVEFMCALLTSESGNLDKTALYVEECRRMGIECCRRISTAATSSSRCRTAPSALAWAPSRTWGRGPPKSS